MKNIIILSIIIAVSAAFFASAHPDGLEKVAQNLGFIERGVERISLMTDYSVPFVKHEGLSASIAGILGVFLMLGLFWLVAALFRKRSNNCYNKNVKPIFTL